MKHLLLSLAACGFVFAGNAQSSVDTYSENDQKAGSMIMEGDAKSNDNALVKGVRVHPVPAQGSTNVECAAGILSITVRKSDGLVLQRIPVNGRQHAIVTFQERGIHILEITDRNSNRHVVRVLVESI